MKTFFGFEEVSVEEKTSRVKGVFESVASKYDLMNDLMSLGVHRFWKHELLKRLQLKPQAKILDVAGGTGDIARLILEKFPYLDLDVTVCDLTPAMMEVGRDRALNKGHARGLSWVSGQAEALPFPDESMDIYTIAFGLRNVGDMEKALSEAFRVLKPGGQFVCLEFSQVQWPLWEKLYHQYSFKLIPSLGAWITGDKEAYQYLVESIRKFPSQAELASRMKDTGFTRIAYENFLGGISSLHLGYKS